MEEIKNTDCNLITGLTSEEVEARVKSGLVNGLQTIKTKSVLRILIDNTFTFFNFVFFVMAIIVAAFSGFDEDGMGNYGFVILCVCNTLIGIVQELRAKHTMDKLSLISAPKVRVIRDGEEKEIAVKNVVMDDVTILQAGHQICADSVVVEGSIEVNESLITGEPDAIVKNAGDSLMSGSYVVSGRAKSKVVHVGMDNFAMKISAGAKYFKKPVSVIKNSLNKIVKTMSVVIVPLGIALFSVKYYIQGNAMNNPDFLKDTVMTTIGSLVGMIPSGLVALTSVVFCLSVIRLARHHTLAQYMYCVETLARVDVLCLDKTGTITDGTMSVVRYIEKQRNLEYSVKDIISSINTALQESNSTSKALENYFGFSEVLKPVEITPFSSERKFSAVTFDNGTYIIRAPEFVLKNNFDKYASEINEYANQGLRVVVLAYSQLPLKDGKIQKVPKLISLILIEDQIRKEAFDTIKYFRESGVEVKVISGDNPVTVSEVSRRVGIKNADEYISLDGLSDDEVYQAATQYTVFGRVKPNQKQIIVKALKDAKHTVAMTGDGVNDILALKEADCSIAMASGSDAVRSVAKLVLLDSNFASMPAVVGEGRRVINNIQQTSILFFVKTLFIIILAALTISGFIGVFHPEGSAGFPIENKMDLFMLEFFGIGIPSFFLALQPNNNPISGNFLVNAMRKALPGALAVVIEVILAYLVAKPLRLNGDQLRTVVVLCATYTGFMMLYIACQPFNLRKFILFIFCITASFFVTLASMYDLTILGLNFRSIFNLVKLYSVEMGEDGNTFVVANPLLLTIILALLSYTFVTSITYFLNAIKKKIDERHNRFKVKKND